MVSCPLGRSTCHQTSNIRGTKTQNLNVSHSSYNGLCPIHWNQVLSREWRCSWSSADRRCSNYIWVINSFITYWGACYLRVLILISLAIKSLVNTKETVQYFVQPTKMLMKAWILYLQMLKTVSCDDAIFVTIGSTRSCHNNNLQCPQWRQSWHHTNSELFVIQFEIIYFQPSDRSRTLVGNKIVDLSDVVGASPVGTASTTSSFSTKHLASMD